MRTEEDHGEQSKGDQQKKRKKAAIFSKKQSFLSHLDPYVQEKR